LVAGGSNQWRVPLLLLLVLILVVGSYASLRTDVFLTPLNIRHILLATAPFRAPAWVKFIRIENSP
jgi:ribose transport system ATP-binding protein